MEATHTALTMTESYERPETPRLLTLNSRAKNRAARSIISSQRPYASPNIYQQAKSSSKQIAPAQSRCSSSQLVPSPRRHQNDPFKLPAAASTPLIQRSRHLCKRNSTHELEERRGSPEANFAGLCSAQTAQPHATVHGLPFNNARRGSTELARSRL